ncbi:MAG: hypothetical protein MUO97_01375 [Dehalococcoidia bacterium]|nr:hypothetical protein [Dehalococcoidia bacterium]
MVKLSERKLKIAVDIDGVVSDFVGTFIPLVKEKYCVELTENDIYVHDLFLVLGITEQEALELIIETLQRPICLIPGAAEALKRISEHNEISLITARPSSTREITARWLSDNKIRYDSLIWLKEGNKHLSEREFDIVIDDHLREVIGFHNKAKYLVVFDHPWNQTRNVKSLVTRVYTWNDIENFIDKLRKET